MFRSFLPRETNFFDYFEQHISLTIEGCKELLELVSNGADVSTRSDRIKEIEHKTDDITHTCIDALHKTFITPIDRGDIHRLIRRLDDIIDAVDAAAMRIKLYEITRMRSEARDVANVLVRATREIGEALKYLRDMKNAREIEEKCIMIYQLENDGDVILRAALVRLFKESSDPIEVIKWKEILELLEKAVDRCEDVANIIQGVVIEAS
ncbi:MAG: DUF47 family protein [bacterium]